MGHPAGPAFGRPMPPLEHVEGMEEWFALARDVATWMRGTFIEDGSPAAFGAFASGMSALVIGPGAVEAQHLNAPVALLPSATDTF